MRCVCYSLARPDRALPTAADHPVSQRRLTLAIHIHAAKVSQESGKGGERVPQAVQVCRSFTGLYFPCLITPQRTLLLPHTVSSLSERIVRDRGAMAAGVSNPARRSQRRPLRP